MELETQKIAEMARQRKAMPKESTLSEIEFVRYLLATAIFVSLGMWTPTIVALMATIYWFVTGYLQRRNESAV